MNGNGFLLDTFPLIAFAVAAACIVAIIVIMIRQARRTGRWGDDARELLLSAPWIWLGVRWLPLHNLPASAGGGVFVTGIDIAFLVGFLAVAGLALTYAFRKEWDWRMAWWQTSSLLLAAAFVFSVVQDVMSARGYPWIWLPTTVIVIAVAPFTTRLAYLFLFRNSAQSRIRPHGRASTGRGNGADNATIIRDLQPRVPYCNV